MGSGTGSLAIALSYRCRDVVSVDVDTEIVHRCRAANRRLLGRVRFVQGDGFHLEGFADGEFDVAFSQGLLEHFSDREILALLSEQLRVARLVVFSVPNNAYGRPDFGDERLITGEQWEQLLNSLGLHLLERRDYRPFTERLWREPKSMTLIVVGGPRTADR